MSRSLGTVVCLVAVIASCSTEPLVIRSIPVGATATVNGTVAGDTPVTIRIPRGDLDKPIQYRVEKENYQPAEGTVTARVAPGRVVGAVFTLGILLAFRSPLYLPEVTAQLQPVPTPAALGQGTIEERLQKIESLRSKGLISEQEYTRLRGEVLGELHAP